MDGVVRYVRVMPTFQLGPRSQLELGGAPAGYTSGGLAWSPRPVGGGPQEFFLTPFFRLGAKAPLAMEDRSAHFGCAARVRDRRQTLVAWHGCGYC